MDKDLEFLARNVSEWPSEPKARLWAVGWYGFNDGEREPDFIKRVDPYSDEYTKSQWLQARKDLGLIMTEEEAELPAKEWAGTAPAADGVTDDTAAVQRLLDPRDFREQTDSEEEAEMLEDMINHPPHYQSDNGIECIDAIRAALGKEGFIAYCRGNVIKYSWRIKANPAEDQGKAAWYANKAKEALEE